MGLSGELERPAAAPTDEASKSKTGLLRSGLAGRPRKLTPADHRLTPSARTGYFRAHEPAHTPSLGTFAERLVDLLGWASSTSVVISTPANGQRPGQRRNFLVGPVA